MDISLPYDSNALLKLRLRDNDSGGFLNNSTQGIGTLEEYLASAGDFLRTLQEYPSSSGSLYTIYFETPEFAGIAEVVDDNGEVVYFDAWKIDKLVEQTYQMVSNIPINPLRDDAACLPDGRIATQEDIATLITAPDNDLILASYNAVSNLVLSVEGIPHNPLLDNDSRLPESTIAAQADIPEAPDNTLILATYNAASVIAIAADRIPASPAAVGSQMTLQSGERDTLTAQIENALLNESDGRQLLQAIINKINSTDVDLAGLSVAAIASAVATAILAIPANKITTDAQGKVSVDKTGYTLTSVYDAAKNAVLQNDSRLDNLDETISSRSTFDPSTTPVKVSENQDKVGYSLTSAYDAAKDASSQTSLDLLIASFALKLSDARSLLLDNLQYLTHVPSQASDLNPILSDLESMASNILIGITSEHGTGLYGATRADAPSISITLTDRSTTPIPLSNVVVEVRTSLGVVITRGITDINGQVKIGSSSVISLYDGDYQLICKKAGVIFDDDYSFTVSSDAQLSFKGTIISTIDPAVSGAQVIFGHVTELGRVASEGDTITIHIVESQMVGGELYKPSKVVTAISSDGLYSFEAYKGVKIKVEFCDVLNQTVYFFNTFTVTSDDVKALATYGV